MGAPLCTDEEFIALWRRLQSATLVAQELGGSTRQVFDRRRRVEERHGIQLGAADVRSPDFQATIPENGKRVQVSIENGVVLVGSDAHYWPGLVSAAHRAMVVASRELKPRLTILNGDMFDGASISRHPRNGWESRPTVKQELEAVKERLSELLEANPNGARHWTWGNHDIRFNARLAAQVAEFEGCEGMNLTDHFPAWKFSTSVMINGDTMVKHRWHNGIHCSYNNTLKSGVSIICGHTHSLKITPWTDYTGTRYGVDTGTLAAPDGPQFEYSEDAPANHRSGFAVLTFHKGRLMPPELLEVIDEDRGLAYFRGQVVGV